MVECKDFSMYSLSPMMLFGKTPKIKFICRACGMYNESRMPLGAVQYGLPTVKCDYCNEVNYIPIQQGGE